VLSCRFRPPALVAKQAGSLAALFDNRLNLVSAPARCRRTTRSWACRLPGAASGWTKGIDVIAAHSATTRYHGEFYDFPTFKMTPAPNQADSDPDRATPTPRSSAPPATTAGCNRGGDTHPNSTALAKLKKYREEEERIGLADGVPNPRHLSIDGFTLEGVKRLGGQGRQRRQSSASDPYNHRGRTPSRSIEQDPQPEWFARNVPSRKGLNSLGPPRAARGWGHVSATALGARSSSGCRWRFRRPRGRPQGSARGPHFLSPEYRCNPRLTANVQSRSFLRHTRETRRNYAN